MRLLAIDPGVSTGWALFVAGKLEESGRMKGPSFTVALEFVRQTRPDLLVVEGQWFAPGRNFASVASLIEHRCAWVHAAELEAIPCELAAPKTWIPAMTRGAPGADTKARIRSVVQARFPGQKFKRDEEDAVLLGVWAGDWRGRSVG